MLAVLGCADPEGVLCVGFQVPDREGCGVGVDEAPPEVAGGVFDDVADADVLLDVRGGRACPVEGYGRGRAAGGLQVGRRVDRALGRGLWGVRVEHDDGNYDDGECRGGQQAEGVFRRGLLMESFIDFSLVMRVLQLSVWRPGWWRSCSY